MNAAQFKCLLIISIFAIIGFGPVSLTCLIGMYIVLARPQWFLHLVSDLYDQPHLQERLVVDPEKQTAAVRIKCFLSLLGLFIIDILPIPTTAIFAYFIIFSRPKWFFQTVINVYGKALTA